MATILRSSKYVRSFAEFANRLGSSYVKSDIRRELVSQRLSAPSTLARRSLATQAATKRHDNESNLETNLRWLDSDAKKFGRISKKKLEHVLGIFQNSKFISSTQALMVIRCCGNLLPDELPESRSELVNQLWKTLENAGTPLDLSHYNALLRVYVENEYAFSPTEILSEMESKGIEPNKLTYQRLITRYCQQGDIDGASKILEFMREKGISVNENIFTALVRGHSEAKDMVSAADILSVMRQAGLQPSADTYKELICGYAKHGDIESVTRTITECQTNNIHLLDTDYLSVINALAINGHSEHVDSILSIMPKEVGYMHDAMSHVMKLVHAGHMDVAMKILHTVPNREGGRTGGPVIKQLMKTNVPTEQLLALCKEVEAKGINSRAILLGLESNLTEGNIDGSLAFIKALKELGQETREHYYWPILVAMGRSQDNAGIIDLLRRMQADIGHPISGETLCDYVLPYQNGEPDQILAELLNVGVPTGTIASCIVYNLIFTNKLKEVADFAPKHIFHYSTTFFCRPLTVALAATRDASSYVKILQHVYENRSHGKIQESQRVASPDRILEPYLIDVAYHIRDDKFETLSRVLEDLLSTGIRISDAGIENLLRAIGPGPQKPVERIINRFRNLSGRSGFFDPAILRSEIQKLEEALGQSRGNDESVRNIKNRLFGLYCRVRDIEKLEKLITEFEEQGVEFTTAMYKQLIDAYLNTDLLGKTDEYIKILQQRDPEYSLGDAKFLKYICLLAKEDRVDDIMKFLQDEKNIRARNADQSKAYWLRFLNALAQTGSVRAVKEVFELFLEKEYIDISGPNVGSLVKVHLVRGDLKEAVSEFERICETYQHTPLKNELTKKLIEAEDATALQRVTDLSTQVHGESNSLYDLVTSFIECNCLRQAKKILEIPALHSRVYKLQLASKRYSEFGLTNHLENLVAVIKDVPHFKVMPEFYEDLLHCYANENDWEKGLNLYKQMLEEEVEPSSQFLSTLAKLLRRYKQPIPFDAPNVEYESIAEEKESQWNRPTKAFQTRQRTTEGDFNDSTQRRAHRSEASAIETLINNGKFKEAVDMAESLLKKGVHPYHRVLRYMMQQLSAAGEIELIKTIGKHLSVSRKKAIFFEDSICKAHIAAGKGEEYFDYLEKRLNREDESNPDNVLSEFPVLGVRLLLEQFPELTEKYSKLAVSQANQGNTLPINTLWINYFTLGNPEADKIWSEYLIKEPRVLFHSILRAAQKAESPDLIKKLIKTLNESPVIAPESKGVAYSGLIKLCYLQEKYEECFDVLREALSVMSVDNLSSDTLSQMKTRLNSKGLELPADIASQLKATKQREQIAT